MTSFSIRADKPIAFERPVYGGSGCPQNKTVAVLSPDGSALSILFNNYVVIAGGNSNRTFTKKDCKIQIPIEIPEGFQLGIIGADYRGFNDLPCNAKSILTTEYAFSNSTYSRHNKTFLGPIKGENYLTRHKLQTSPMRSECGKNIILQIKNSVIVQANSMGNQAMSGIDSIDIAIDPSLQNGITLYFEWLPCR